MMNNKLLAVAVAGLLSTGLANAAVGTTVTTTPIPTAVGGSDLILTVWDQTSQASFSANLGVSNDSFLANDLTSASLSYSYSNTTDAAWANFESAVGASDTVVYSVVAADSTTSVSGFGVLTTASPTDTLTELSYYKNATLVGGPAGKIATFDQAFNSMLNNGGNTGDAVTANTASTISQDTGYAGSAIYGNQIAGSLGKISSIDTAVGANADFYRLTTTTLGGPVELSGMWNFNMTSNAATLTYTTSTIPLPATAWMFLSGAMGVLAVKRRKNTAV